MFKIAKLTFSGSLRFVRLHAATDMKKRLPILHLSAQIGKRSRRYAGFQRLFTGLMSRCYSVTSAATILRACAWMSAGMLTL